MPFVENCCLMKDINQLGHLDKLFFLQRQKYSTRLLSHLEAVFISSFYTKRVNWNLPDPRWQAYYQPQPSLLSLRRKPRYCRRRIWTALLSLVYASVRNHTSCPAHCVNHICTRSLTFVWIFYSAARRQRFTEMISAAAAVTVCEMIKNLWRLEAFYTRRFARHKAFVSDISSHVSLCQYACSSVRVNRGQGAESWVSGTTGSEEVLFSVESGN